LQAGTGGEYENVMGQDKGNATYSVMHGTLQFVNVFVFCTRGHNVCQWQ